MTHLWDRLAEAAERLPMFYSQYAVVFEVDGMEQAGILVPDPNWMAAALEGGILSPLSAHLNDLNRMYAWMGANSGKEQTFSWDKIGGANHPYADPIGPLTEEQAIEYLIMKDLPPAVWADAETANRPRFKIVRVEMIPTDRSYRNAWRLAA